MTSNTSTLSAFTSARICNKLTRIEFFRTRIDGEIACGPTSNFLKSRGNNPCYHYPLFQRFDTIVQSSIFLNACIPTRTFPCSSSSVPNPSEPRTNDACWGVRTFKIVGFHASREGSKDCFRPGFLVCIVLLL